MTQDPRSLRSAVKRAFSKLPDKVRAKHPGTFHAYKDSDPTRRTLLESVLALEGIQFGYVRLKKTPRHVLSEGVYEETFMDLMLAIEDYFMDIVKPRVNRFAFIVADCWEIRRLDGDEDEDFAVNVERPCNENALQVADLFTWGCGRHFRSGDSYFFDAFSDKIIIQAWVSESE